MSAQNEAGNKGENLSASSSRLRAKDCFSLMSEKSCSRLRELFKSFESVQRAPRLRKNRLTRKIRRKRSKSTLQHFGGSAPSLGGHRDDHRQSGSNSNSSSGSGGSLGNSGYGSGGSSDPVRLPAAKIKLMQARFVLYVDDFLAGVASCPPLSIASPWVEVLYYRMYACEDIISHELATHYRLVLDDYLSMSEDSPATRTRLKRAQSLLDHFRTHAIDPCCSLLGMRPSFGVETCFRAFLHQRKRSTPVPIWPSELKKYSENLVQAGSRRQHTGYTFTGGKQQHYSPGTSVVCVLPGSNEVVFGNVRSSCGTDSLHIFTSQREAGVDTVHIDNVSFLPEDCRDMLNDKRTAVKLVADPVAAFFNKCLLETRKQVDDYLTQKYDMDIKLIKSCGMNQASIKMLVTVKKIHDLLEKIKRDPPQDLWKLVADCRRAREEEFLGNLKASMVYTPTLQAIDREIEQFDVIVLASSKIQQYYGICASALLQLNIQIRDLLNGATKRQLSDWWLELIEVSVSKYLRKLGYKSDAVPENYMLKGPTDYDGMYHNLRLVREILDKSNDIHQVQPFVKDLRDKIYPKIDEFIEQGKIVLANQFELDREKEFDMEMVEELFEQSRDNLENVVSSWLDGMIKDLRYLERMKELEVERKDGKLSLTDAVPISGLIFSCFYRLENELKTILELWPPPRSYQSPVSPIASPLSSPPRSPPGNRNQRDYAKTVALHHHGRRRIDTSSKGPPPRPPMMERHHQIAAAAAKAAESSPEGSDNQQYARFMGMVANASDGAAPEPHQDPAVEHDEDKALRIHRAATSVALRTNVNSKKKSPQTSPEHSGNHPDAQVRIRAKLNRKHKRTSLSGDAARVLAAAPTEFRKMIKEKHAKKKDDSAVRLSSSDKSQTEYSLADMDAQAGPHLVNHEATAEERLKQAKINQEAESAPDQSVSNAQGEKLVVTVEPLNQQVSAIREPLHTMYQPSAGRVSPATLLAAGPLSLRGVPFASEKKKNNASQSSGGVRFDASSEEESSSDEEIFSSLGGRNEDAGEAEQSTYVSAAKTAAAVAAALYQAREGEVNGTAKRSDASSQKVDSPRLSKLSLSKSDKTSTWQKKDHPGKVGGGGGGGGGGDMNNAATMAADRALRAVGSVDVYQPHGPPSELPDAVTVKYPCGDTYIGQVFDGVRHGIGEYTFANGDRYRGQVYMDEFTGRGKYTFRNGDVYNGIFRKNQFWGRGMLKCARYEFVGNFSGDRVNGYGVCHFRNGERFTGFFKNNKRHGRGTYVYLDGLQYRGLYENDQVVEGRGAFTLPDLTEAAQNQRILAQLTMVLPRRSCVDDPKNKEDKTSSRNLLYDTPQPRTPSPNPNRISS